MHIKGGAQTWVEPGTHGQDVTHGWRSDTSDTIPDKEPFLRVLNIYPRTCPSQKARVAHILDGLQGPWASMRAHDHCWVSYGVKRPQPLLMNGSHRKHICSTCKAAPATNNTR